MIDLNSLTIASKWDTLRATVIPPDAPPVQITETRRAYAGFSAALDIVTILGEPSISYEEGLAVFIRLSTEVNEFVKLLEAGKV